MARPRKDGNQYFSLDADFFSDKKVKILKARYGADGICIFLYLLCEIYKSGYYLNMDDDFEFILSDDLHMNCDKVKQVLTFLLERSLFDNKLFQSDAVLTSAGIQRRFQLMVKSRAVKNPITVDRYWLLSEEETETFIKVRHQTCFSENNNEDSRNNLFKSGNKCIKESKGNKRKENNSTGELAAPGGAFVNPELEHYFQLFLACRRNNEKTTLNEEQIQLLREELQGIASTDQERIAAVKKAAASGWKSFYRIDGRKKESVRGRNRFNNMESRERNMDSLELALLEASSQGQQIEEKDSEEDRVRL